MAKKFKYKSKFETLANITTHANASSFGSEEELVANVSLEDLKALIDVDEEQIEKDDDLLYSAFNAFVVNLVNANDDGIMTPEAKIIASGFERRQANIEHSRWSIIGYIMNHGFSEFATNKMIKAAKIKDDSFEPFNVALAAVLFRVADEWFTNFVEESSQPDSPFFGQVSASWELGFNEFILALGTKKLAEAEIVSDPAQIAELSQFLRANGGSGFTNDGVEVYRVVKGEDLKPLGIGFTASPASAVKGLVTASAEDLSEDQKKVMISFMESHLADLFAKKKDTTEKEESEDPDEEDETSAEYNSDKDGKKKKKKTAKAAENISQSNSQPVKISAMKIDSIEQLRQENWEEIEASNVRDFVKLELEKANTEYLEKLNAASEEQTASEEALAETKRQAEEAEAKTAELEAEVKKLKEEQESQARQVSFNQRMAALDEEYDLDDESRKMVRDEILELDEEAFASWKSRFDKFATALKKSDEEEEEENSPEQEATAGIKGGVKNEDGPRVPNTPQGEDDRMTKLKESFAIGKGVKFTANTR